MEFNPSRFFSLKLCLKYASYKMQQSRLKSDEQKIVQTAYGKVCGVKCKSHHDNAIDYYAFEGIPFAKPPLGELRFRAPQRPEPWQDVLHCKKCKPKPMQMHAILKIVEGSEDCLYLNVYSKRFDSDYPLPVMVWIYGGAFTYGEASREVYSPEYFMRKDIVLVTIAYRVGVFGFLCLDNPELNVPGNAGLKDQIMALRWIKENIKNFNGDPNNITVFGESAGAASTHLLMLTPQAKGLFHKAIIQSGSALCPWACNSQHNWGFRLVQLLGYKGENNDREVYTFLQHQSAKRLVGKEKLLLTKDNMLMDNMFSVFGPVIEPFGSPDCIANKPFRDLLPQAWGNEIPLIIGGNADEGLFYHSTAVKHSFLVDQLNEIKFANFIPSQIRDGCNLRMLEELRKSCKEIYFNGELPNAKEHLHQYLTAVGDIFFWHPIYETIKYRQIYASHRPTYCYYFQFDSPTFNHARSIFSCDSQIQGTCHADDLSYLFVNILSGKLPRESREFKCMERMIGMWCNFALTSNPNCKEIKTTQWQTVGEEKGEAIKCLMISDNVACGQLPIEKRLQQFSEFFRHI